MALLLSKYLSVHLHLLLLGIFSGPGCPNRFIVSRENASFMRKMFLSEPNQNFESNRDFCLLPKPCPLLFFQLLDRIVHLQTDVKWSSLLCAEYPRLLISDVQDVVKVCEVCVKGTLPLQNGI